MLISYPVLPASAIHDDEDIYLSNILEAHVMAYEGRYPVSVMNGPQGPVYGWHGGVHLYGGGEPLRAIADGTVVAFRFAAQRETYGSLGDYDTSFVLLKHEAQTGENTSIVFYSPYMHLANKKDLQSDRFQQLPSWLRQASAGPNVQTPAGQKVWRKDVLGFAGQLYGREAAHFEVFMLDADFNRVWRDSSSITQGTGSDDWFGDAHFVIPAQQTFAEKHPRAATTGPHRIDFPSVPEAQDFALPLGQDGQNTEPLYVSVQLAQGRRIATTYRANADGGHEQVGHPVVQENYEYELYRLATVLYPDCPSAGFEWLRFGRVLGPDSTTRNENWQLVRYSEEAIGYISLAPDAIAKLSDADFPHWHGWQKRDEGSTANAADGICDDEATLALVRAPSDANAGKLRRFICKAPSEWDDSDLATRFARLREPGQPLESDDNWNRFTEHVGKMAFWSAAGLPERSVWHFHPLQFVRHFRKCGYLTSAELAQCIPRTVIEQTRNSQGQNTYPKSAIGWSTALNRATALLTPLNQTLRKYCLVENKARMAAFFGNSIQETIYFSRRSELGGAGASYAPYYGRGLMQLTHEENYTNYKNYRGWSSQSTAGIRDSIESDAFCAADSAGFYWASCSKPIPGSFTINRYCEKYFVRAAQTLNGICGNYNYATKTCQVQLTSTNKYYESSDFEKVARAVNTGNPNSTGSANGLVPRTFVYAHVVDTLADFTQVVTIEKQRP